MTNSASMSRWLNSALESDQNHCPICGKELETIKPEECDSSFLLCLAGMPLECECVTQYRDRIAQTERAERTKAEYSRMLSASRIPARYLAATTDQEPRSLYIYGGVGTGKTHLACALLLKAIEVETVLFVTTSMLQSLSIDERGHVFDEMASCGLLAIDDLGKSETSEWALSLAFRAIDERYRDNKPLIITSNYSPAELGRRFAQKGNALDARAIVSRLSTLERIHLDGSDRRARSAGA